MMSVHKMAVSTISVLMLSLEEENIKSGIEQYFVNEELY